MLTAPETLGGAGTPAVAAFTPEPLAVALGCSPASASTLLADALDLHHRLPLLWDQTHARRAGLEGEAGRHPHAAPLVDAASWVDRQLAGRASRLGALPSTGSSPRQPHAATGRTTLIGRRFAADVGRGAGPP